MNLQTKVRQAFQALLGLGLLVALVVLVPSACGGEGGEGEGAKASQRGAQEEGVKDRPLPRDPQALSPGEYHSVRFRPSLSFMVGKGWISSEAESADFIEVGQLGGFVSFANVRKVFKPGTRNVVEAPKDLLGWLRHNPYLKTSKPEPVTLGGVEGEQLDVVVDHLPKDYYGNCGTGCLDVFYLSGGEQTGYFKEANRERRVFVLEDVKGETVVIWFAAPPEVFDKFAPKAQKVVDSVKWRGGS